MLRSLVCKRNVISISLVLLALAALTVVLKPSSTEANEEAPFKGTLTVEAEVITAIGGCASGDVNCTACLGNSSFYIEAQGVGDTSLGTMFGEVLKCFNPTAGSFGTYAGTLTTTAPNGKDSLTWAYSGQNDNAGDSYGFGPFSGVLTVTGGTGKFDGASGSATFTAASGPSSPGPSANSVVGMAFYSIQGNLALRDNDN
jgi:hypothetical protein